MTPSQLEMRVARSTLRPLMLQQRSVSAISASCRWKPRWAAAGSRGRGRFLRKLKSDIDQYRDVDLQTYQSASVATASWSIIGALAAQFLIRIHHRIAGMCADARPICLLKTNGWLDGIEWRFWSSGIERLGSYLAVHDALRFTIKLALQASDWKLSYGHE